MKKIEVYKREDVKLPIKVEDYIKKSNVDTSPWFMGLQKYKECPVTRLKDTARDILSRMPIINGSVEDKPVHFPHSKAKTAKFCPAIHDILKTSYLLSIPMDMEIFITRDGRVTFSSPEEDIIAIDSHPFWQFESAHNLMEGRINLKFVFPYRISTNMPYLFLNPTFHTKHVWDVVPGIINAPYTNGMDLNINTLVDLKHLEFDSSGMANIRIKADTVLAYMWLPYETKLVETKEQMKFIRKKF